MSDFVLTFYLFYSIHLDVSLITIHGISSVQYTLVKPNVRGVEEDEDLPDDELYVFCEFP